MNSDQRAVRKNHQPIYQDKRFSKELARCKSLPDIIWEATPCSNIFYDLLRVESRFPPSPHWGTRSDRKALAGLFGAAPLIALVTLLIALSHKGAPFAAVEGRSMILGARRNARSRRRAFPISDEWQLNDQLNALPLRENRPRPLLLLSVSEAGVS